MIFVSPVLVSSSETAFSRMNQPRGHGKNAQGRLALFSDKATAFARRSFSVMPGRVRLFVDQG
jgi:hypothetical protein